MRKGPRGVSNSNNSAEHGTHDRVHRPSVSRRRKARKIRYHDEEWDRIVEDARACGIPAATYVRRVSLGARPRPRRHRTENDLILPLSQIAADLQRLARVVAPSGDVRARVALKETLDETLAAIRRIGQPRLQRRPRQWKTVRRDLARVTDSRDHRRSEHGVLRR